MKISCTYLVFVIGVRILAQNWNQILTTRPDMLILVEQLLHRMQLNVLVLYLLYIEILLPFLSLLLDQLIMLLLAE